LILSRRPQLSARHSGLFSLSMCALLFASSPKGMSNVVGTDLQNFNASTSGIDYVSVQASETLEPGYFNVGLMLNYAVNTLPVFTGESDVQSRTNLHDTLLTSEYLIAAGLLPNLEGFVALGHLLRQSIDEHQEAQGQYQGTGLTNYRFGVKYHLGDFKGTGFALASSANINRIRKNPYLGTRNSPIYHVEAIADRTWGRFDSSFNIGYRWRSPGGEIEGSQIEPTVNQWIVSAGINFLMPELDTKLIAEIYGSRPVGNPNSDSSARQASSAEAILGLKHDLSSELALHFGGGSELINGVASPDWRLYSGINWTFGTSAASPHSGRTLSQIAEQVSPNEEKVVLYSINFDTGSYDLTRPGSKKIVDDFANFLKDHGDYKRLLIEGHTDSIGAAEGNLALSRQRAEAIKSYLNQNFQIDASKMETVGFGESAPIADNGNMQGRLKNRRVVIRIFK
jgi:outer membrane protein OmpA-like peptidoglycan-associated protein